jgi:hypothetical protein
MSKTCQDLHTDPKLPKLVENIMMAGEIPTMSTVYHLNGSDLRMTHYRGAQNQPRLMASHIDESTGTVEFSFVDVTNAAAHPVYVKGFVIHNTR